MDALSRRKFRHRRTTKQAEGAGPGDVVGASSRRAFLRSTGGYAAGAATLVGVPAAVLLEADAQAATPPAKTVPNPKSPVPAGPVMAYVHDAKKGTVVIMSGTSERTVQDHALVQKLLHAPSKKPKRRLSLKATKSGAN